MNFTSANLLLYPAIKHFQMIGSLPKERLVVTYYASGKCYRKVPSGKFTWLVAMGVSGATRCWWMMAFYLFGPVISSPIWSQAVITAVQNEFHAPNILLVVSSLQNPPPSRSQTLLADAALDPVVEIFHALSVNWSILNCDIAYQPPTSAILDYQKSNR